MKKVKYIGNMKTGKFHTSEGVVFGNRNEEVSVTSKQFDEITPAKDWVGIYPKTKTKKEEVSV